MRIANQNKHLMNRNYLLLIFGLLTISISAQSFYWGYPFPQPNETEKTVFHVFDDNHLYRVSKDYDQSIFNYHILADQFSLNELEKEKTLDLSVEQPPMGLATLTFVDLFQLKESDFIFFYYEYNNKTKKNNLYSKLVNIRTGKSSDLKPAASMDSRNGNFQIAQSPGKNRFAALKELPFEKNAKDKVEVVLLDKDRNVLSQKEIEFPFDDQRNKKYEIYVSDEGRVVLLKYIKEKKEKPYFNLYEWNPVSDELSTISLRQEDNYQIFQYEGGFLQEEFYFQGLLTHEESTDIGLKIDFSGRYSGVRGSGVLAIKIKADGQLDYDQRNNFEIMSNLNIKNLIYSPTQILLVCDRSFTEKKSKSSNIGQAVKEYDYNYLNNGFYILGLDKNTGQLQWDKRIDTSEPNTKNDNGDFLSVLSFLDSNNRLVLLYNETRDINKGAVHMVFNRRFPIMEIISGKGETLSREPLLAAGIGVVKEEPFELNTQFLVRVNDNKFILRASNRVEYKYGYVEFMP